MTPRTYLLHTVTPPFFFLLSCHQLRISRLTGFGRFRDRLLKSVSNAAPQPAAVEPPATIAVVEQQDELLLEQPPVCWMVVDRWLLTARMHCPQEDLDLPSTLPPGLMRGSSWDAGVAYTEEAPDQQESIMTPTRRMNAQASRLVP